MERDLLIQRIRSAFAGVTRGPGVTLHEAIALDGYRSGEELNQARARDTDTNWEGVPDEDIEQNPEIFPFLDFAGLAYYLPAYMVWSLRNFDRSQSASPDHLFYTLDYRGPLSSSRQIHFGQLSDAQRAVTAEFLHFMSKQNAVDADAAQEALDVYWGQFLEGCAKHEG